MHESANEVPLKQRPYTQGSKSRDLFFVVWGFFMNGWIKLHRKLLDNPIVKKPAWISLWVILLLLANHNDEKCFIWKGKKVQQRKGQFVTGRKKLREISGVPESTIERILSYLESEHQIGQQKTTKYRLITILKWEEYQKLDNKTDSKWTTNGHNQELKELKNNTHANRVDLSTNKKSMKKNSFRYSESQASDTFEDVVDADSGAIVKDKTANVSAKMREVISWAENRRGGKFINYPKQLKALSMLKKNNVTPNDIQNRWTDLEKDNFYRTKGLDFMDIVNSFDKKPR